VFRSVKNTPFFLSNVNPALRTSFGWRPICCSRKWCIACQQTGFRHRVLGPSPASRLLTAPVPSHVEQCPSLCPYHLRIKPIKRGHKPLLRWCHTSTLDCQSGIDGGFPDQGQAFPSSIRIRRLRDRLISVFHIDFGDHVLFTSCMRHRSRFHEPVNKSGTVLQDLFNIQPHGLVPLT